MIRLEVEHPYYRSKWQHASGIHSIGVGWLINEYYTETALPALFQQIKDADTLQHLLKNLSGAFAVVVETERHWLVAVDIIRTYPLFIGKGSNGKLTITDFIREENQAINITAESFFQNIYCTPENQTLLEDWQALQGGEYAVIDKASQQVSIHRYFQHSRLAVQDGIRTNLAEAEKRLLHRIQQYAAGRTILIPLSGGYDSRYLLALLKEAGYPRLECFTYGKPDSKEVAVALQVCRQLNITCHTVVYTPELLQSFFSEEWKSYTSLNHHYTSLPHEQDFFALNQLKEQQVLPENAVVMNGYCLDILAGSYLEAVEHIDIKAHITLKHELRDYTPPYSNDWNGYQEWLVLNRLSKFIVNAARVYTHFGLDVFLPFWDKEWVEFWYRVPYSERLDRKLFKSYVTEGIFERLNINLPAVDDHIKSSLAFELKRLLKTILPDKWTKRIQQHNASRRADDPNLTLYLYDQIYTHLKNPPAEKDFRINNIHAQYFLENLRQKQEL